MRMTLSGPRAASYILVVLTLAAAAHFGLGHALIAGLFAFMMLDHAEDALLGAGASPRWARWSSVALFVVVGALLAVIFAAFVRIGLERMPMLLDRMLPRVDSLAGRFGVALPVDNVEDLRALILSAVKDNARSIETASGLMTRGFFQILIAIVVAILKFVSGPAAPENVPRGLDDEVLRECGDRAALFSSSFDLVMGAQVLVAAINTALAAAFLIAFRIPFRTMLTLTTFVCGMIPIVGNVISNSLIVGAALTRSDHLALFALIFLVVVHKGGYFLNSRIVGARMETPTWAILLGLLIGEALMGVTGVILAPTLIHYAREELRALSGSLDGESEEARGLAGGGGRGGRARLP
ncbi:MAG TPA: AI-2E family transporter [Elusimicrobiota bacterium]|jgi:predicted PurR-regulated permease PerM|nr:AI-2E family transporter [Elusimicrobiota bacterium]